MKGIKSIMLNDATLLMVSTVLVNAGNYAINLILGRILGPEIFAEVSVIATGVLMLSFIAVGIQLTTAKYTATYYAENDTDKLSGFVYWISQRCWIISILLSILLLICSPLLQSFFHFRSILPFIIIILGLPFYFDFSLSRGQYQGTDQFRKLAMTYLLEMVSRLIVTIVLIYIVIRSSGLWATEAVSIGFLASFMFTYFYTRRKSSSASSTFKNIDRATIKRFVLVIGLYEMSQIMINNSDIMLVKHFFENSESGIYASLALIGRVVFFATWTIVTLLFPKVIQYEKQGKNHEPLFWGSLGIVAIIGGLITMSCYFGGEMIMNILFGSEYIQGAPLLYKYATATTLFACANVFAYYYMSLNKYFPVIISIGAGIVQIVALTLFHTSLLQVIMVQVWVMLSLFLLMVCYYLVNGQLSKRSESVATVAKIKTSNVVVSHQ